MFKKPTSSVKLKWMVQNVTQKIPQITFMLFNCLPEAVGEGRVGRLVLGAGPLVGIRGRLRALPFPLGPLDDEVVEFNISMRLSQ